MTSTKAASPDGRDWSQTLYLPKTDFPMKAGLPQLEPRLLARWAEMKLYDRLRAAAKGRPKFVLHDGPPYANGNIHIGHALNKILKDLVTRSHAMLGYDSNYVPGWDCHGLPIEWKIEEQYRAKGQSKDAVPVAEFRKQCRDFALHWIDVQREEFRRLGVEGDWAHPYSTMAYHAEATIAGEIMKFAMNGLLYRGSKPVMWSVVEKTALAEAEVEYQDYQSDTIWVKFPVVAISTGTIENSEQLSLTRAAADASVVIWTTTPWTIPGNRAVSFSSKISYGLYEVTAAPDGNWAKPGDKLILADKLAAEVMKAAKVESFVKLGVISAQQLTLTHLAHPLRGQGYDFDVPLLDGDHVTDDTGTGFVHTAPGHGTDDFAVWMTHGRELAARGIDTAIPYTVDGDGVLTAAAPGFNGKRVLKDNGDKGDANDAVIKALATAGALIARGRLKHQYPHSWRSKKPVIYRNTPQWFIAMDKPFALPSAAPGGHREGQRGHNSGARTLRDVALEAIRDTAWVPAVGENRITGMIANRPDWVVSRQRAWGVPITVFRNDETGEVIPGPQFAGSDELMARIKAVIAEKGADGWFEDGARERLLAGLVATPSQWTRVNDILDVWFDSGSTHAYTLEDPEHFPGLAGIRRKVDGGVLPEAGQPYDRVMYLEGSDQHRGWFHSSLLESCGTRGRAPFDVVLTHGFVLDEKGQKMSKSLGNVTAPQDVIKNSGADILRLWVAASDYADDLRIGPEILKTFVETYRKVRNTMRWMLGTLAHHTPDAASDLAGAPELERLMLHRLAEIDGEVRKAYEAYDYKRVVAVLTQFLNTDLSAFYFDIRKDALYCDAPSSPRRRAALATIEHVFRAVTLWLAPILPFTAEEAWLSRYGSDGGRSVHLETFMTVPAAWRDDALDARWATIRRVRGVVTGALELERAAKRMGSSLEAAPAVYVEDAAVCAMLQEAGFADICITSDLKLVNGSAPADAFRLPDVPGVGVVPHRAEGRKCARSWRITKDVGSDPAYPDLSARDAAAMREIDAQRAGA